MKEPIGVGYYRLDIPTSENKPEVNRIVDDFTKRFDEALTSVISGRTSLPVQK